MKNRILFLILYLPSFLIAQENQNMDKEGSYILTDFSYQNDAIFLGRRDSISTPYLSSSLGYYNRSGLFVDASMSYLTKSNENRIDLVLASFGYRFGSNKFTGVLSGTKYFFNDKSYNVQSEIEGDFSAVLSYDFGILEASLISSSYFSKNTNPDFFLGAQIAKSLFLIHKRLLIKPTFNSIAGSQYFYQEYYRYNRIGSRKGNTTGQNQQTVTKALVIDEVSKFSLLNIEISLPIQYYYKSILFSFSPKWAFPQTNATITTADTTTKESLNNIFYWSAGISFWFNTKKDK